MWLRNPFAKRRYSRRSSSRAKTARSTARRQLRPRFEPLEQRRLLAITDVFDGVTGALDFTGDAADDGLVLNFVDATGTEVQYDIGGGPVTRTGVTAITFDGGAGANSITINGSTEADVLTVDGDQIDYAAVPITLTDVQGRTIATGDGDDRLTIQMPLTTDLLWDAGGGLADTDRVTINGEAGQADTIDVADAGGGLGEVTVSSSPGVFRYVNTQLGDGDRITINTDDGDDTTNVTLSGAPGVLLPEIRVDGGAGSTDDLNVVGRSADDDFNATPVGFGFSQIEEANSGQEVAFLNVAGVVVIDGAGGNNSLSVGGRDGVDDVTTVAPDTTLGNDFFVEIDPALARFYGSGFSVVNVATGDEVASDDISVTPLAGIPVNIDGELPGPEALPFGDALEVDISGAAGVVGFAITGVGTGVVTDSGGAFAPVSYTDIEKFSVLGGTLDLNVDADAAGPGNVGDGSADTFGIGLDASGANVEIAVNGTVVHSQPVSQINVINVLGSSDDDTLTVDNGNGVITLPGGIVFDGEALGANAGPDGDVLELVGDPGLGSDARETYGSGPAIGLTPNDGAIVIDPDDSAGPGADPGGFNGDEEVIQFFGLSLIRDVKVVDRLDMFATAADDEISIVDGPDFLGSPTTEIGEASGNFVPIQLANKDSVVVNGLDGIDRIDINNPNPGPGLDNLVVYGNELTGGAINADDDAADFFIIRATATGVAARIRGQGGSDAINLTGPTSVSLDAILGPVDLVGGETGEVGVGDTVILFDRDPAAARGLVTLTDSQITGLTPQAIDYTEIEDLILDVADAFDNTIDILSTADGTSVGLDLSDGATTSTVTVGNQGANLNDGNGTLDNILGPISVDDGSGTLVLQLDDSSETDDETITIAQAGAVVEVTGVGPTTTTLAVPVGVSVYAGSGNDSFVVDSSVLSGDNMLAGNAGDDTIDLTDVGGGARTPTFDFLDSGNGNMDITGLPGNVLARSIVTITYAGDAANDDQVTVAGTTNPDLLTVTPTGAAALDVTLDGGVAGGGPGPDLSIAGVAATGGVLIDGDIPPFFSDPGDTLLYEATGPAALDFTGPGEGVITAVGRPAVNFTEIEFVETIGIFALVVDADDAGPGNVNDGNADDFLIQLDPTQTNFEIFVNGTALPTIPVADVEAILFAGSGDDDTLTVNNANGLVVLPNGLFFDGEFLGANAGPDFDALILEGDPGVALLRETYATGPSVGLGPDAGIIVVDPNDSEGPGGGIDFTTGAVTGGDGDEQVITFTGLEPVFDTTPVAQLDIFATPGDDDILIGDGPGIGAFTTTLVEETGGGFESIELANKTTVTVNGMDGADTIAVDNSAAADGLTALEMYGNELTDGTLEDDDNAADTLEIEATAAAVTVSAFGQGGDDLLTAGDAANNLDAVLGPVNLVGGEAGEAAGDTALLVDFAGAAADPTITITATDVTGIAASVISYSELELLDVDTTNNFDTTVDVLSTDAGTITFAQLTGAGNTGTITAGNETANFGDGTGDLDQILGDLIIDDAGGTTVVQLDDTGDAAGDVAVIDDDGALTQFIGFGPGTISYVTGDGDEVIVLAGSGGNTIDVQDTSAAVSTLVDSGAGNDTVTIAGDNLTADNQFVGNTGTDTFALNVTVDLGGTSLSIEGNDPAADAANRDVLGINDLGGGARNLTFIYPTPIDGGLDVVGFATDVNVETMETVTYTGDAANDDLVTVEAPDDVDFINVTPTGPNGADIDIDGGVAGGQPGPDLSLSGLDTVSGMLIDGGLPSLPLPLGDPGDTLFYNDPGPAFLDFTGQGEGKIFQPGGVVIDVNFQDIEFIESVNPLGVVIDADDNPATASNDGLADEFLIQLDADTGTEVEIYVNGLLLASIELTDISSVLFNGSGDDDTLTVRNTNGVVVLPGGILFDGEGLGANVGPVGDLLIVDGDPGVPLLRQTYVTGPLVGRGTSDGIIVLDPDDSEGPGGGIDFATGNIISGNGDEQVIEFFNLSPVITVTPVAQLDIFATAGGDTIDVVDGPNSGTPLAGGFVTTQVNDAGSATFESIEFANKATVTVNGGEGADTFRVDNPAPADGLVDLEMYGNELTDGLLIVDDGAVERFDIEATGATAAFSAFGQAGDDIFDIEQTATVDAVLGAVNVDGGPGDDTLNVDDSASAGPSENITITGTTIDGITGSGGGGGLITYQNLNAGTVTISGSAAGHVYTIESTAAGLTATILNSGEGSDQVTINDGADTANGVVSPIELNAQGDVDSLTIVDTADPVANVYHMNATQIGGGGFNTPVVPGGIFGADGILTYNGDLENLDVAGPDGAGVDNEYNIDSTGLGLTDGAGSVNIADGQGNATFNIQADQLSAPADHAFRGGDGADTFHVHLAAAAVVTGNSVAIFGDPPAADSSNRDLVNLIDAGGARTTTITYRASVDGGSADLQIDAGTLLETNTVEQINYLGEAVDDTVSVVGSTEDDELTVAPVGVNTALVFIGGDPWDGPDLEGDFFDQFPGVAGGSTGPDLFIEGIVEAGITFDGGGSVDGDKLYVYAPSEGDLIDAATTIDPFGFGVGVIVPSATTMGLTDAFDEIFVSDSLVTINQGTAEQVLPVAIVAPSFVQTDPVEPGLIVNSGFETLPDATGIADDIIAELSFNFAIVVNGGDPDPDLAPDDNIPPDGDRLQVETPDDVTIYSTKGANPGDPPIVSIASGGSFGLGFSSIESILLTPGAGSQTVNIYGDNNSPLVDQNDNYVITGQDVDAFLIGDPAGLIDGAQEQYQPDADGDNEFVLEINGSSPIMVRNVIELNVFGDDMLLTPSVGPDDVDRLELTPYADDTPTGWGIDIAFDEGNPDLDGIDTPDLLVVNGVAGIAELMSVVPAGPGGGQFVVNNASTGTPIMAVDYTTNTAIIVNGSDGSAGDTDTLLLLGTSGSTSTASGDDTFDVNFAAAGVAADPIISVSDTATGDVLYQVINVSDIGTFNFLMDDGNDQINLTPSVEADVFVDGGNPIGPLGTAGDVLNLLPGGADFELVVGPEADEGTFLVDGAQPISFDHIEVLQLNFNPYSLPDELEPNDSIAEATVLGSVPKLTLRDLSIHLDTDGTTNDDFYRITAADTGMLIVNAFFTDDGQPGNGAGGNIDIEILDAAGNVIDASTSTDDNERIAVPVVTQQVYFLRVFGVDGDSNVYDLEIENFAAPVPTSVVLDPNSDSGASNLDLVTFVQQPRLFVQARLSDFVSAGIPLLDAAQVAAGDAGVAVEVFINGTSAGFAAPLGMSNTLFVINPTMLTDVPIGFAGDPDAFGYVNLIEASVRVSDGQAPQAVGYTDPSETLNVTFDPNPPDGSLITLGNLTTGPATSIREPAFGGVAEANTTIRVFADNGVDPPVLVGEGRVGSDLTDGVLGDGLGLWEVTVEPLDDGIYTITVSAEDRAGNVSDPADGPSLVITIDDTLPQRPTIDLLNVDDTGRSAFDNITIGSPVVPVADQLNPGVLRFRITSDPGTFVHVKDGNTIITPDPSGANVINPDPLVVPASGELIVEIDFNALEPLTGFPAEGPHPLSVEAFDVPGTGNFIQSEQLLVEIDFTPPDPPTGGLAPYSDTGTPGDNITSINQPAFVGLAEANAKLRIFADDADDPNDTPLLIGEGFVNSDESDGNPTDGLGAWEVTVEPLADGIYNILVEVADIAGNVRPADESLLIEGLVIDRTAPQRPTIDLVGPDVVDQAPDVLADPNVPVDPINSDTGMSGTDNITKGFLPNPGAGLTLAQFRVSAEAGSHVLVKDGNTVIAEFDMPDVPFVFVTLPLDEDPHPLSTEAVDAAGNSSAQSEELVVIVDVTPPGPPATPDMLASSDSGAENDDNVTNVVDPAFSGVEEANSKIHVFANGVPVGLGIVGSDDTDGVTDNGLGVWEVTVEPLADGLYDITTALEDVAGNLSDPSEVLAIEIDTIAPNTPFIDLLEAFDTGRHNDDNITNVDVPFVSVTTHDTNAGLHLLAGNLLYRIFDRPESAAEELLSTTLPAGFTDDVFLITGLLQPGGANLADGFHDLKLEVEDRAGNLSEDYLLDLLLDRVAPAGTVSLHPDSDTGVAGYPATMADRITADNVPLLFGGAEADAVVAVTIDDVPAGTTVAVPLDGDDAFPPPPGVDGNWLLQTTANLSDGLHTIVATFEDPAGNRSTAELEIFVDTQGPQILSVFPTADPGFNLFAQKYSGNGTTSPTPLIDSLSILIRDLPERVAGFLYDALFLGGNPSPFLNKGQFLVKGDAVGVVAIQSVAFVPDPVTPGNPATGRIVLTFVDPLPDDRYTLTISDNLLDVAGNHLDGEADTIEPLGVPDLPSGDGIPGGVFVGRFTVDSRPEIGVWAAGSVWIDINGNFVFDPENTDAVNRDIAYTLGFTSDDVFAGNFAAGIEAPADGFDKLAAYGRVDDDFRWLIDLDHDGNPDIAKNDPANVNGLPVAGRFDPNDLNGDEVAVVFEEPDVAGSVWYFDTNHDFEVGDLVLVSQLQGYPVVGDFDGDGFDDLATWKDDTFQVDLADGVRNGWDGVADATFGFGFIGVRERPVAADLDGDGYDDLGLWVPDRAGAVPTQTAEWYFLISGGSSVLDRIEADPIRGNLVIEFTPIPFGNDIYARYGDEFAAPVVGNFDPPSSGDAPPVDDPLPDTLTLAGTGGDDVIDVQPGPMAGSWLVTINGEVHEAYGDQVTIAVDALGGRDVVTLVGTAGTETGEINTDRGELVGDGFALSVVNAEEITIDGVGGEDIVKVYDTFADDHFIGTPTLVTLVGGGYSHTVKNVRYAHAYAKAGGVDVAQLYDSPGDDTFFSKPAYSWMSGEGYFFRAKFFEYIHAYGREGGNDWARLYDSPGNDELLVRPLYTWLASDAYFMRAKFFETVDAYSTAGGVDTVRLIGDSGDNRLTIDPMFATFTVGPYTTKAVLFESVAAYGRGGNDTVELYDAVLESADTTAPTDFARMALLYDFDQIVAHDDPEHGDHTVNAVDEVFRAYWD